MRRMLLLAFLVVISSTVAHGASIFGRVIEVNSGDVITVFNLNRPVRIKLLGVDAPELNQTFGDVAKKHLAELVYDKSVIVEYSGIAADGSLTGRVLLNGADIGAQMIRDGAAWFDPNNVTRLSADDREVYLQSEQAARNERRGLWQAESPTAPWQFAKDVVAKKNPTSLKATPNASSKADRSNSELTNLTLMATPATGHATRQMSNEEVKATWTSLNSSTKEWHEMRPSGQNFSAFVPGQGRQITQPLPFGDEVVDVTMYMSQEGGNLYALFWLEGPSYGESDKTAIDSMVKDFIKESHKKYERADRGHFFCERQVEKDISMNGYTGREFDMSTCSLPTRARGFTKVTENRRQMYVGLVFYGDDDPNVMRFIKSFTAGSKKTRKGK